MDTVKILGNMLDQYVKDVEFIQEKSGLTNEQMVILETNFATNILVKNFEKIQNDETKLGFCLAVIQGICAATIGNITDFMKTIKRDEDGKEN